MKSGTLHRIRLVAAREFFTTVSSKGFLIGVLVMPVLMIAVIMVLPRLMANRGAQVEVEVAVIDASSSAFADGLRSELQPEAIAARQASGRREAQEQMGAGAAQARLPVQPPSIPAFRLKVLPAGSTLDGERAWLIADAGKQQRRALIVITADDVGGAGDGTFGTYDLHVPRNLPQDAEGILHSAVRPALIGERLRSSGIDPELVGAATQIPRTLTKVETAADRRRVVRRVSTA